MADCKTHARRPAIRLGFTLVELLTVLCILSLVASGGMLALTYPLAKAKQRRMQTEIEELHAWLAERSRTSPCELVVDLDSSSLTARQNALGKRRSEQRLVQFDGRVQLKALLLDGSALEGGQTVIEYFRGWCRTFALVLGENKNGTDRDSVLLLCTGLDGRTHRYPLNAASTNGAKASREDWQGILRSLGN
ncbi:MAG: type II secretion system protein [Planctomycetota bacterium]